MPFATGGIAHRLTLGVDCARLALRLAAHATCRRTSASRSTACARSQDTQRASTCRTRSSSRARRSCTLGWRDERVRYAASDTLDPAAPGFFLQHRGARGARDAEPARLGARAAPRVLARAGRCSARAGRSFRFVNVDEIYESDAFFSAAVPDPAAAARAHRTRRAPSGARGAHVAARDAVPDRRRPTRSTSIRSPPASATPTCRRRAARASSSTAPGRRRAALRLDARATPTPTRSSSKARLPGSAVRDRHQPERRRQARAAGARAQAEPRLRLGHHGAHAALGRAHRAERASSWTTTSRTRSARRSRLRRSST